MNTSVHSHGIKPQLTMRRAVSLLLCLILILTVCMPALNAAAATEQQADEPYMSEELLWGVYQLLYERDLIPCIKNENNYPYISTSRHEEESGWFQFGAWFTDRELDYDRSIQILTGMMTLLDMNCEEMLGQQASVDTNKTFWDYSLDVVEITVGAISMGTAFGSGITVEMELIAQTMDIAWGLAEQTIDEIETLECMSATVAHYSRYKEFLMPITIYCLNEEIRNAASVLLSGVQKLFYSKMNALAEVGESAASFLGKDLAIGTLLPILEDSGLEIWTEDELNALKLLNKEVDVINAIKTGMKLGVFATDMLFGFSNETGRIQEMIALRYVRESLIQQILVYQRIIRSPKDIEYIRQLTELLDILLYVDYRGQYCMTQLLVSDGQITSLVCKINGTSATFWDILNDLTAFTRVYSGCMNEMFMWLNHVGEEPKPQCVEEVVFERSRQIVDDMAYEFAVITGKDITGHIVWSIETDYYEVTQLYRTVDIGIHNGVYYYIDDSTVKTLSLETGDLIWSNEDYGGSPGNYFFDSDGTLYICGQLGPELCVIDQNGNTICRIEKIGGCTGEPEIALEGRFVKISHLYSSDKDHYVDRETWEVCNDTDESNSNHVNLYAPYLDIIEDELAISKDGEGELFDIDRNGTDELILMTLDNSYFMTCSVYTIVDGVSHTVIDHYRLCLDAGEPVFHVSFDPRESHIIIHWETGETGPELGIHREGEWNISKIIGGQVDTDTIVEYEYTTFDAGNGELGEDGAATKNGSSFPYEEFLEWEKAQSGYGKMNGYSYNEDSGVSFVELHDVLSDSWYELTPCGDKIRLDTPTYSLMLPASTLEEILIIKEEGKYAISFYDNMTRGHIDPGDNIAFDGFLFDILGTSTDLYGMVDGITPIGKLVTKEETVFLSLGSPTSSLDTCQDSTILNHYWDLRKLLKESIQQSLTPADGVEFIPASRLR